MEIGWETTEKSAKFFHYGQCESDYSITANTRLRQCWLHVGSPSATLAQHCLDLVFFEMSPAVSPLEVHNERMSFAWQLVEIHVLDFNTTHHWRQAVNIPGYSIKPQGSNKTFCLSSPACSRPPTWIRWRGFIGIPMLSVYGHTYLLFKGIDSADLFL